MTMPTESKARAYTLGVAPNGARRTRDDHPAVPMTPVQLAKAAAEVAEAGASMFHVHVRDGEGRHVLDADVYRDALEAIRREIGDQLVLQITTESVGRYGPEAQMSVVREVRPEAVSLALRELCPDAAHESQFATFMGELRALHVATQVILHDQADVSRLAALVERGVVPQADPDVLFVLGSYADEIPSEPTELGPFLRAADGRFPSFMVCAFGYGEAACGTAAVVLGGSARIGFENNVHLPDGTVAPSNAALALAVTEPLGRLGYQPRTGDDLREIHARRMA